MPLVTACPSTDAGGAIHADRATRRAKVAWPTRSGPEAYGVVEACQHEGGQSGDQARPGTLSGDTVRPETGSCFAPISDPRHDNHHRRQRTPPRPSMVA